MKNNLIIGIIIALVIGLTGGFFGGLQYQKSQISNMPNGQFREMTRNLQGQRPVSGQIIEQDDKTITVKIQDGSSKIVILSNKTSINKTAEGTKSDLKNREQVTIFGTQNSDGSVTAANIQIGRSVGTDHGNNQDQSQGQ